MDQANLYLSLADAPFDREDPNLNPAAGACVTCPRRSGYNTALFADVVSDQCLDSSCYHGKVEAFFDREIAAHPGLVQIENGWRNPKEQRPGAVQRGHVRELEAVIDNSDAEPVMPCEAAKPAIVVYGKHLGRKLTVCTDKHCTVHDPQAAAEAAAHPVPTMAPAPEIETEEEAAQREAEHQQRMAEYKAEQERKEEERKAEFERQQKEFEAEQARRDKQRKARVATFERIIEEAPASFSPAQLRVFLRLLIHLDYSFLEEVATHYANSDENTQQSDDEIVLAALNGTADEKLTGLALRLVLSDHVGIPHESQPDLLAEAEQVFATKKPKVVKAKTDGSNKPKPPAVKLRQRKRRQERKHPKPLHSGPGFVRGRSVSRQAAKSRRETPLRFLPDPHPALLPALARRLRGRRRSAFCTSPVCMHHASDVKRVREDRSAESNVRPCSQVETKPNGGENTEMSAIVSKCGFYRYRLERRIESGPRTCLFIMLNPSKADATIDDPTITRCINYARSWGYGKLVVGNLFAFRTTYPTELKLAVDPVGPENKKHLSKMFREADIVIAAWGNHGDHRGRAQEFHEYTAKNGIDLHYLKLTKQGHPSHPGRLAAALQPKRWS